MSADRETNHDMTNSDITLLLAEATDEVEIGIAPYEAVVRGGRRRRARRWAVATATALVIAGSSATLAVAGLPGGDGAVAPAATQSPTTAPADLLTPHRTTLASGTVGGEEWRVVIDVWAAPRTEAEAAGQLEAMGEAGEVPTGVTEAAELVGKSSYHVRHSQGGAGAMVFGDDFVKGESAKGTDLQAAAVPFDLSAVGGDVTKPGGGAPNRLVIGQVGHDAQEVTCTWKDGTNSKVERVPEGTETSTDDLAIRPAEGSPVDWFVCLAPKGTEYESAEVTAVR